jgi:hypothetical protein
VRICRIAVRFRVIRSLGARLIGKEPLETAAYQRYGVSAEDIGAGSVLLFFTTFVASSLLLFCLLGYLSLMIGLPIAYGFFTWFRKWIPRQLERERLIISCETPLILQEIALASAASESIFDLAMLLATGKHRFVSPAFSRIIQRINNGDRPEKLVIKYAHYQPCESLRRYLLDAISLNLQWGQTEKLLRGRRGEAESEYQKYTLQAETRILLIVGFGTFWPIIFSIAVFVNNLWRNHVSMIIVAVLFSSILYILERRLMAPIEQIKILGGEGGSSTSKGLLGHTEKEELQETISLVSLMGEIMHRENVPPERALKIVGQIYRGWLSTLLTEMVQTISYNGETFRSAWARFAGRFSNPQCRQILGILPKMIEKTSEAAGQRLIEVSSYIKENQTLVEERENIIGAQRFKAKLLLLFSSAALGLVGALSPLFMMVGMRQFSLSAFGANLWTTDTIFAVMVLLFMVMMNAMNTLKAVGIARKDPYLFSCVCVFLVVFISSTRLIIGFA